MPRLYSESAGAPHKPLLLVWGFSSPAQTPRRPPAKPTQPRSTPSPIDQAEDAIARNDFAAAEPLLKSAAAADPKDHRAWYDLGYVYSATGRKPEAIEAYRKSVAAKPDVFESNLNLGILLAERNNPDAVTFLRAATRLKPARRPDESNARAWLALGRAVEATNPKEAVEAYGKAATLQPKNAAPHLAAGIVLERTGDLTAAESEFKQARELDAKSSEAVAGLVNVYTRQKRLREAEAMLRQMLALDPTNAAAHVQLGRVLAAQNMYEEATAELEAGMKASPDPAALRELAGLHALAGKLDVAAQEYGSLLAQSPNDAQLHYSLGTVRMNQHSFPEAQQELLTAVKLKPDLAEAYGNLAVVAAENKDYALAIHALDARAHHLPETPATYFLRATAYDHLRAYKQAAANYHQFLTASNGQNPDQEWQARHRLVAIEPKK